MNSSNTKLLFNLNITDGILLMISYHFIVGIHLESISHLYASLALFLFSWNYLARDIYLNKKLLYGNPFSLAKSLLKMYVLLIIVMLCIHLLNRTFDFYKLLVFIHTFFLAKIVVSRLIILVVRKRRKKGVNLRKTIIVGNDQNLDQLKKYLENNLNAGYKVVKEISFELSKNDFKEKCKLLDKEITKNPDLDEVIFVMPLELNKQSKKLIDICDFHGIYVKHMPYYSFLSNNNEVYEVEMFDKIPLISLRQYSSNDVYNLAIKRVFDIVFSLAVLIIFSPIFIILGILIKLDSKGPVFYKPIRIGRHGKEFVMYKFRSMKSNDNVNGGQKSTEVNDPRITKVGAFIRRCNLDEIPQFLNVLRGDMSVVGPRPHRVFLNNELKSNIEDYMLRHYFKPGITGWAQVNGWRGPTETLEQRIKRTKYDLFYLENRTFLFDLKIVLFTVFKSNSYKNAF